jgi:lipid-binding SYLF domain-containing protein
MNRHITSYQATHHLLRAVAAATAVALIAGAASAQTARDEKYSARVERAAEVLDELVALPDHGPPDALLSSAACVAVVPGVVQVGLGVGGRVGYGIESCRTRRGWSQPTFVSLKGGSFGFQVGAQSADVVLIFANENAARHSLSTFDLGAGASVAAGPIGRNASAETDYRLQSEIYSYSKSKGVFAGVSLSGTRWEIDRAANDAVYRPEGGDSPNVEKLLTSDGMTGAPALVQPFLASLERNVGPGTYGRTSARR